MTCHSTVPPAALNTVIETNENLLVEVLIYCFTLMHKFMMNHTILIKKAISMTLIFDFNMRAFLGLGDSAVFDCMLCLFVSGSYWKTQVSSPMMICLRISGSSLLFSSMSSQNLTRFCFWSSDKSCAPFWHTPFTSTDHAARSSAMILCLGSVYLISFVLSTCDHFVPSASL